MFHLLLLQQLLYMCKNLIFLDYGWGNSAVMEAGSKVPLLLVAAFLLAAPLLLAARRQNLEVQRLLTRLNKPSGVSIQSPDGDTIDCVDLSQQPGLDHPFLKNHTIQMSPSYHPDTGKSTVRKKDIIQLWQQNGRCPEGTIPVRRTKEEDVLRATSIQTYGKKTRKSMHTKASAAIPQSNLRYASVHEYAYASVRDGNYYGTKATINLWSPKVEQPEEFSLSQVWILGGSPGYDLNSVEAGWQVYPKLYGDSSTRLFVYWTRDSYGTTGCYNSCPGFVQVSNDVAIGGSIQPVSNYGSSQYDITILIWKDPKDGNWWLRFDDHVVGYWPEKLFTHLTGNASVVEWGGEVVNLQSGGQHTTTQMGSGKFPDEGYHKASYMTNIQVVDSSNKLQEPNGIMGTATKPSCYDIELGKYADGKNYFYYGGPGRGSNCP